MPWAMVAFVLMPFGLERLALVPMGWGVDGVIAVARHVAVVAGRGDPGQGDADRRARRWSPPAGCGSAYGAGAGAWPGWPGSRSGSPSPRRRARPTCWSTGRAGWSRCAAPTARWRSAPPTSPGSTPAIWLRRNAQWRAVPWPDGADGPLRCDALGCIWHARGRTVALDWRPAALAEDCAVSDLVVSRAPAPWRLCRDRDHVIDRFSVWREGAYAVWLDEDRLRVVSVRAAAGERPWVPRPEERRARR